MIILRLLFLTGLGTNGPFTDLSYNALLMGIVIALYGLSPSLTESDWETIQNV